MNTKLKEVLKVVNQLEASQLCHFKRVNKNMIIYINDINIAQAVQEKIARSSGIVFDCVCGKFYIVIKNIYND
jgi:hypothetical protein